MTDYILPSIFSVWNKLQKILYSTASSSNPCELPRLKQLSEMVYEVYTPHEQKPELEIVFFHGLQFGKTRDAHVRTWMSQDNSHLWIQTWLVELFPKARILTASYDSSAERSREFGSLDMYCTAENLVQSLTGDAVRVGQGESPVVFVGHCLGGLVLKELCLSAAWAMGRKSADTRGMQRIGALLSSIQGMFYYSTPHIGSLVGDNWHTRFAGELFEEMETLKATSARRNQEFDDLRFKYGWITSGMGELRKTYVESLGTAIHFVPEASSRQSVDFYYSANTDHYDICKAEQETSSAIQILENFIRKILKDPGPDSELEIQDSVRHHGRVVAKGNEEYIDFGGRAKEVRSMLDRADVHTVFIVGLSGIGKTALAREVYNGIRHNFDVLYFASLDSIEGQSNGSKQVWRKIQEGFQGSNIGSYEYLSSMPYQLKGKKVLMVVDNVESQSQLDVLRTDAWLEGSSSNLIVTSTTSRLGNPSNTFEVGYLSAEDSVRLFRQYAFQGGEGPSDLRDLIQQVIEKCDNYPLFLKVLAGFVRMESDKHPRQLWLELLDRLEKVEDLDGGPDYKLWAKLRMCYNVLQPSEKEIFLDSATIFHGFSLSWVNEYVWKDSREVPRLAWLNLKSRFLVSAVDGRIQMHTQLRGLGRSIACPKSKDVEKWKRISNHCVTRELRGRMSSKKEGVMETLAVELKLTENDSFKLERGTFRDYDHLQYLILEGGGASSVTGWGKVKLPQSLVYLRWRGGVFTSCPLDLTNLEKLVVLELVDCKSMKYLPPGILKASRLTWLELEGCSSLTELPLGLSKCLKYIGLKRTGLRKLPNDSDNFKKLVDLKASETNLTQIPEGLGGLQMLTDLDLSFTRVTILPESLGDLKSLKTLNLESTKLISLPNSIGGLQDLEFLILNSTMLAALPESIGLLKGLKKLDLDLTSLKSLPRSIGDLVNLRLLTAVGTPLETLPDSFSKLRELSHLYLSYTQLRSLPETIGELTQLKLFFLPLSTLRSVPQTLGQLLQVRSFAMDIGALFESLDLEEARRQGEAYAVVARDRLSESDIHSVLSQVIPFHAIEYLSLSGRGYPQSLVQPLILAFQKMPSLRWLSLQNFNLVATIPWELGKLTNLQHLGINGWETLQELPESLGNLQKLHSLTLRNNPSLSTFPESLSALPSLRELHVHCCGSLQSMPCPLGHVSIVERKSSTSEGHQFTPLDCLQPASPPGLRLDIMKSDSWSLVECFLECSGKHYCLCVDYIAECKEMEKAQTLAFKTKGGLYVLQKKMAVELFSGKSLPFNPCCQRTWSPSTSNCWRTVNSDFRICCRNDDCKIHRFPGMMGAIPWALLQMGVDG
ncbi:unnamed protein product [Calypogeia fissa]